SSQGFTGDGRAILSGATSFALVLRASPGFNPRDVDTRTVQVGNNIDVIDNHKVEFKDADHDGSDDLRAFFDVASLNAILAEQPGVPVALRYEKRNGSAFEVPDIFALGAPIEFRTTGIGPSTPVVVMRSHPNPFRSSTTIQYSVGETPRQVDIVVYDASGRRVKTLVSGMQSGDQTATWNGYREDGVKASTGVYFVKALVAGQESSERIILLR
ncbi:MAG TPA: FlgD immunoglobulin-like domain containing protein, partial [Candidatus Eisenbacteria bacterium]|nr:FlgD immunoglobulin-like domain containing protein [Candidatus Eisenbacteria bacterium]